MGYYYYGHRKGRPSVEVFTAKKPPTHETHGGYTQFIGPFYTRDEARHIALLQTAFTGMPVIDVNVTKGGAHRPVKGERQ